jgi:hypothetical protein
MRFNSGSEIRRLATALLFGASHYRSTTKCVTGVQSG